MTERVRGRNVGNRVRSLRAAKASSSAPTTAIDTITFDSGIYVLNGVPNSVSPSGNTLNQGTGVYTIRPSGLVGNVLTKVVCEGMDSTGGDTSEGGATGGGGGANSVKNNVTAAGNDTFTCNIHNPGLDDDGPAQFFDQSLTQICVGDFATTDGIGGQIANCIGDTKHSGGNGGSGGVGGGGGGGSRASQTANGNNGVAGGLTLGGAGGAAPSGGFVGGGGGNTGVAGQAAPSGFGGGGGGGFGQPSASGGGGRILIMYSYI